MFDDLISEIQEYFLSKYPAEACGIIIEQSVPIFVRCINIVPISEKNCRFEIGSADLRKYENLLAVIHSHPDGLRCPSARDMECQMETAVPWGIVRIVKNPGARNAICAAEAPFWFGDQMPRTSLIGRSFRHGVTDCYALIRDWYREKRRILLKNVPRDWNWWKNNPETALYEKNFKSAGFRMLQSDETPSEGDLAFFRLHSSVINHAAVLCEPGIILHHFCGNSEYSPDRLSIREPIGRWLRHVQYWVRYEVEDHRN